MKAMILAAGLGKRMRPLTDALPKPLLPVAGKPLIEYHLEALCTAGVREVVINVSYLGQMIIDAIGSGRRWGLNIQYSVENEPLETAGGIVKALPLLGESPFILINGDVWTDYPVERLVSSAAPAGEGHLVMVENPAHNSQGDFGLSGDRVEVASATNRPHFTFSGVSILKPELISRYPDCRPCFPLREVFEAGISRGVVSGEVYRGRWCDVGTPERLRELDQILSA